MVDKTTPKEPDYVNCDVCLAEIPESVAMSSEADAYTHHFCGIECYNKWRDSGNKPQEEVIEKES